MSDYSFIQDCVELEIGKEIQVDEPMLGMVRNLIYPENHVPDPAWEPLWDKLAITAFLMDDVTLGKWDGQKPPREHLSERNSPKLTQVKVVTILSNGRVGITDDMDGTTADAYVYIRNLKYWKFKKIK